MFGRKSARSLRGWRSESHQPSQYLLLRLTYPGGKWKIVRVTDNKTLRDVWETLYCTGSRSTEYRIVSVKAWQ